MHCLPKRYVSLKRYTSLCAEATAWCRATPFPSRKVIKATRVQTMFPLVVQEPDAGWARYTANSTNAQSVNLRGDTSAETLRDGKEQFVVLTAVQCIVQQSVR